MEPYVGHPYEVIGRIRLNEALAKAELARLLREQPERIVRRRSLRDHLVALVQNRPARVANSRARVATASGRTSAGQASLGLFDA